MSNLKKWLDKNNLSERVQEDFVSWLKERAYSINLSEEDYDKLFSFFARDYLNARRNTITRNND